MDDEQKRAQEMPQAVEDLNRQELIRDWELLFWTFLLFGLGRLFWLYVAGAVDRAFQLGISCGFLFCGILGFLMRYVLSPGLRSKRMAGHE
jgi:hypothetical protein